MNSKPDFSKLPKPSDVEKVKNSPKIGANVPKILLEAIYGNSPYLAKLAELYPDFLAQICEQGFDASFASLVAALQNIDINSIEKKELMAILRHTKNKASLLIALGDISTNWDLTSVTHALSDIADLSVQTALKFLLKEKFSQKLISSPDAEKSGYIVIAVGKLGSRALNYSSDIDLVILYDESKTSYAGKLSPKEFYIRLTQELVEMIQSRTGEGYVFRVDLRLRPDPYSTPIAVSVDSAIKYYFEVGQNWERAAMIKARFIAGDAVAGQNYLNELLQYIWRENLDFKALEDIRSVKRQIDSKADYAPVSLLGYNIKLGKGGIREIEFFAQTQQLIWGGRELPLRTSSTRDALKALEDSGKIQNGVATKLSEAYEFYRKVEHRLQMVADEHTHNLPNTEDGLQNFAIFLGFENTQEFKEKLSKFLSLVQLYYAKLFEESASLSAGGNLVFTGVSNDPETLITISKLGFKETEKVCEIIRGWHHGRRPATRFKEVRENLTEQVPHILNSFARSSNPDESLIKFDDFLGQLPSGVEIFQLFEKRPELIDLIAEIMGNSPWLAENLSRSPDLVKNILLTDFSEPVPLSNELKVSLDNETSALKDFDDKINIIRHWKHDMEFQVGIRLLKNFISHDEAAEILSAIAEIIIGKIFWLVLKEEEKKIDGKIAIIAMGKLGMRDLTFGSDLDLVFVYESADLEAASYYTKIVRKFTSCVSTLSSEGILYNIDLRLRPSGEKGSIACSLETYEKYYQEAAWNWEFMALTKARIIYGKDEIYDKVNKVILGSITKQRDRKILAEDMSKMREKIAENYSPNDIWDIKYAYGGLFEIEFIFQYLILTEAANFPDLAEASLKNLNIAETLKAKAILSSKAANELGDAYKLLRDVQSAIRLTSTDEFSEEKATENHKKILLNSLGETKFDVLKNKLIETQKIVHTYYKQTFYFHSESS